LFKANATINALLSFGLLRPRATIDESVAALRELGPTPAAQVIARHKVRRLTRRRIAAALPGADPETTGLLETFDAEVVRLGAPRERRGTDLDRQIAEFRARAGDLPVRFMKGLGVRDWYSEAAQRDIGDADLWLPDMDTGLRFTAVLRDLGFFYEPGEMPWLKRDMSGVLFGQFRMQHADPERVDVDVHIGPYSVRYCGLIDFAASQGGAGWTPLTDEDNLCAVIGNAAGDCLIDGKVVNDLVLATGRGLDLEYVRRQLEQAGLTGFANNLIDRTKEICALDDDQVAVLSALRTDGPAEEMVFAAADDDDLRTELVVAHARSVAQRLTGSESTAEGIAEQARAAYGNPRSFRIRTAGGAPHRLPTMNPWTCVRLAPQPLVRRMSGRTERVPVRGRQTALSESLTLVEAEVGDLLLFRDDVFLPTLDYLFCSQLVTAEPQLEKDEAVA